MNSVQYRRLISGASQSLGAAAARAGLRTLVPPYRLAVAARNMLFDYGLRDPVGLPRKVVSIGNLTVGGTGKTPFVALLAKKLVGLGHTPAVLLRGYRAAAGLSDEQTLLKDELGLDIPVEANPDRRAAALAVLARHEQVAVFLLDDGFQHRQVHRDLDIVLIDATAPFGFDYLLPRGLLREPMRNLRRAGAVVVTRADQVTQAALDEIDSTVEKLAEHRPIAHAAHQWLALNDQLENTHPLNRIAHCSVLAVSGIGNARAFDRSLDVYAGQIVERRHYPDHHSYSDADVASILDQARQCGADAVVTTAKDWVKWRTLNWPSDTMTPIYRPQVQMQLLHGDDLLTDLLVEALPPKES
jgi:tetraacyldisaccharide 4'-kinase